MDSQPETEEDLQKRHRKEQRDLQSRVTQKKKQANKKNRKGVNDECARLEEELRIRQQQELAELRGEGGTTIEKEVPTEELAELKVEGDSDEVEAKDTDKDEPTSTVNGDSASHHEDQPQPQQQQGAGKKRNRAKDRLARRAAEHESLIREAQAEAQNLPDKKVLERERMLAAMAERGLHEREIRADGHCLYSAVADQLDQLGIQLPLGSDPGEGAKVVPYKIIRGQAAGFIEGHREDFEPFLEEPFEDYVRKVRDTGEWGGQLELMALARSFGRDICVLQDFGRVERIESGSGEKDKETQQDMWLGYYKHGFGLGEHYNSLRKAP